MSIGTPHWFTSDSDTVFMSHNGVETRTARKGTRAAFQAARQAGYRWLQVDAVVRHGKLVSQHALLGRPLALRKAAKRRLAAAIELDELLADPSLSDVRWNIEVKSATTKRALLDLLGSMTQEQRAEIMISSPVRTSTLRAVAERYPEVALAAPVWHGGVFGVRFLGRRRATIGGRPYDCQQVYHPFLRAKRPTAEERTDRRPLRQAWTIRSAPAFFRGIAKAQSLTVDGDRLRIPFPDPGALRPGEAPRRLPIVRVLALGGGGWRSAFGAIGSIMYLWEQRVADGGDETRAWDGVEQVVGISGGSFAVAGLAGDGPDGRDPTHRLRHLVEQLERAGRFTASAVRGLVLTAIAAAALTLGLVVHGWQQQSVPAAVLIPLLLLSATFLARFTLSMRSRRIVRRVFPHQRMRVVDPVDRTARRYRIGATGLHDGDLYAFTTHPEQDRQRRAADEVARGHTHLPAPVRRRLLSDAVVRSSSLPGLGQMGWNPLHLCAHDPGQAHDDACPSVPDRLVDGGISGIFGRGLVDPATAPRGRTALVAVDGGRRLVANHERTVGGRLRSVLERFSALYHLSRWLTVAFEISYRSELVRVADEQIDNGYRCRLVRLAEIELDPPAPPGQPVLGLSAARQADLVRLALLRERVHSFSLIRASSANVHRGIAVAVAACAFEFADEPDIRGLLKRIGVALGRGDGLLAEWDVLPTIGAPSVDAAEDADAA